MSIQYRKSHYNTKIIYHFLQAHYPTQEKQDFFKELETYINNNTNINTTDRTDKEIIKTFKAKKHELETMTHFMNVYESNLSTLGFPNFRTVCIDGQKLSSESLSAGKTTVLKRLYSTLEKMSDENYSQSVALAKGYASYKPHINFPEYKNASLVSLYNNVKEKYSNHDILFLKKAFPIVLCLNDIKAQRTIFYRYYKSQKIKTIMVSMTWTEEESTDKHRAGSIPSNKTINLWLKRGYKAISQVIFDTFHK